MDPLQAKANYSRICQLLVDKGGDALRSAFHVKHPSSTLAAVLKTNKSVLKTIRYSVISPSQWNLLFPASGAPDSKNFDITLLTILLRNICGLSSPTAGWNVMPPVGDTSISADILRIKLFRNQVYGHIASPQLDDAKFETLWQEISKPLVNLGIPQQDIDEAKVAPLSPEEESYIEKLKQWKELEDDILSKLNEVERKLNNVQDEVTRLRAAVEYQIPSQIDKLAKFNFPGEIKSLCNKFQHGTRKWFFDELSSWFDDQQSRVMILTAGPGIGKSVLSAKVCKLYKERHQLAACHFCDFKNSDYSNPHRILHSLASQMCNNIEGFRDKLTEVLSREHSRDSLSDAFRVLLNDPLHDLDRHEPALIVVDALDESKTEMKSDFLELISEKFPELPQWVKIFISSRPEMQVRNKLQHFNPIEIRPDDPYDHDSDEFEDSECFEDLEDFALASIEILPDDRHHTRDLKHFVQQCLPNLNESTVNYLISKCEGSFLYANYLVSHLKKEGLGIEPNLDEIVPKGISGFYEKQFKRLETGLLNIIPDTASSILKSFVNIVAASKDPLPIKILFTGMGLSDQDYQVREIIISVMSEILPLYDDCLTVYHKSLWDWLTLIGYEEHAFVANIQDGVEHLWRACKNVYIDIDSLRSVLSFQMTPEKMFALQNGGQYLLDVGEADDFRWLVHIRLNFLKLKCFKSLNVDISRIFKFYKSTRPNHHYWSNIHLEYFSNIIQNQRLYSLLSLNLKSNEQLLIYLQSLANGYFNFMQISNHDGKNEARDILNESKQMWIEEIGNDYIPENRVISNAILGNSEGTLIRMDGAMALSSDNKLLAYKSGRSVEMFNLPCLSLIFDITVSQIPESSFGLFRHLLFSPDSSYLLWNSVRFCVSLGERKVVPFIPHGPDDIDCCSFSSCGMKLVTAEKNLVKVWDVKDKSVLVQAEIEVSYIERCFYSDCNSYILARPLKELRPFDFNDIAMLKVTTLERLDGKKIICADSCINDQDNYQIISPSRHDVFTYDAEFQIRHFHLPSGGILLIANKFCSKPFVWKDRKCVIYFISRYNVVVYDYINLEVVDLFYINCLPGNSSIDDITHLEGTNFFVQFGHEHAFVVSLETSKASFVDHRFANTLELKCCALSADSFYLACCYKNSFLFIRRVDNGKVVQVVVTKQAPEACWWSESYLWVVCEDVVVKYPYDSTEAEVVGPALEDFSLSLKSVLKFMVGVLIIRLNDEGQIAILKICDQTLHPQQIPDTNFAASAAAISRDGCAVLLYCKSNFDYQLWEIACENEWELRTTGKLEDCDAVVWFCLSGEKASRSSIWVKSLVTSFEDTLFEPLWIFSMDFPEGRQVFSHYLISEDLKYLGSVVVEGNYKYSDILIIHRYEWLYFLDVLAGKVISSSFLGDLRCVDNVSSFFIPSQGILVLAGLREIKFLKIRNIKSNLPCVAEEW